MKVKVFTPIYNKFGNIKLYSEHYTNTVLILESKDSKTVQRIGDETLINYDLLNEKTFKGRLKNIILPRVPNNLM